VFTIQDYKEALLYDDSFKSLKIKPVTDEQGEFIFSSGRTAVVFKVKDLQTGKFKALKCFTMLHENALGRNQAIGRFLQFVQSPYLVDYQFLEEEIWVDDAFQPVVVMDWVEGNTLHFTLNSLCEERKNKEILRLALMFDQMALWWLAQNFAHGDLKADNLIITPNNQLVAVDYEGFYVPALQGEQATELGTEDYQHPERSAGFFCKDLDHVSILIISSALHALSIKPELWEPYNHGENLLLTWEDLKQAGKTEIWKKLLSLESSSARNRLNLLMYALSIPPGEVTGLKQVLQLQTQHIAELDKINTELPSEEFSNSYHWAAELGKINEVLPKYKPGTLDITFMPQNKNIPILNGSVHCVFALPNGKILVGGGFRKKLALFDEQMNFEWEFWDNLEDGFDSLVKVIRLQTDGKILVGGYFTSFNGKYCNRIARLFSNGKWDDNFEIGDGFDNNVHDIHLQSNGKILLGGKFTSFNDKSCNRIARLLPNGKWDDSFDIGDGFNNDVYTIQHQADGKILVGGWFNWFNGKPCNKIARLLPNGERDVGFVIGNGFDSVVTSICLQPDGKILVGGGFESFNNKSCNRIARLLFNGKKDDSFRIGRGLNDHVYAINLQSDGKIVLGGWFKKYNYKTCNYIARLLPNGKWDASFDIGAGFDESVKTIQLQPDGKFLVWGYFESFNGKSCKHIARLQPNGKLDDSFVIADGFDRRIKAIQLQTDGKILAGGRFTKFDDKTCNRIARLLPNGKWDDSFNIGDGFDSLVKAIRLQADGKVLVGGEFKWFKRKRCNGMARLLPNGNWDDSFDIGFGFETEEKNILIQLVLKHLGGWVLSFFGLISKYIARLLPNKDRDDEFRIDLRLRMSVAAIQLQTDGKIIVGGDFTYFNGKPCNRVARLMLNGKWDNSFDIGDGFNDCVNTIQLQPDGKILTGGRFSMFNGKFCNGIARLLPNGKWDDSFDIGAGFGGSFLIIETIRLQPDGKILVGGKFKWFNRVSCNGIIRLLPNGNRDDSFDSGIGFDSGNAFGPTVNIIYLQPDGRILVGGYFTSYQGNPCKNIARLLPNGQLDPEFDTSQDVYDVCSFAITQDHKLLMGGNFFTYGGIVCNHIARLNL
jgi:uncharacterized delta-60 repeat protein